MIKEKRCVLAVDDDTRILRSVKDFLIGNKFHVLEATNGTNALNVFYENNTKIDMILLDVMMPGMDGFAILKEFRETSLVPIIMLTARGEEYDQLNGFEKGADDYIPNLMNKTNGGLSYEKNSICRNGSGDVFPCRKHNGFCQWVAS